MLFFPHLDKICTHFIVHSDRDGGETHLGDEVLRIRNRSPLRSPAQVSRGRGLSKPHERDVSRGEEGGRRRPGEGVPGRGVQTRDDLAEGPQVSLSKRVVLMTLAWVNGSNAWSFFSCARLYKAVQEQQ